MNINYIKKTIVYYTEKIMEKKKIITLDFT